MYFTGLCDVLAHWCEKLGQCVISERAVIPERKQRGRIFTLEGRDERKMKQEELSEIASRPRSWQDRKAGCGERWVCL